LSGGATPSPVGPLLSLVRRLIDFGVALVTTLRQNASAETLNIVRRRFGVLDVTVIIARIISALQLATALEARLVSGVAPWQLVPGRIDLPSPRKRPVAQPLDSTAGQPAGPSAGGADAGLRRIPTAKQIAADVRRRSVGVVIAELVREFGIMPCHPLWRELSEAVLFNGGSLAALYNHINNRTMIAAGDPAFPPYSWPDAASEGLETSLGGMTLPLGAAALPAGWMPPYLSAVPKRTEPPVPVPEASGAGPP
jgi:hypothetical protein